MAKKKIEAAEIIIRTTDGGSFKITGKEAEKLTKKMNALGGASQNTDRVMKGVTQQSSNATKNFSKQAQTMQGGLVAVYATIAAQIFAVSAAFQFLKSSMETRNLIEGQKAFGAATGVAYASMTKSIQKATDGMLAYKEAASAGAIGIAAGLNSTQLGALATVAKNASLALGRDLTDSFNRLIRGVTKAEPELLDELGIILRLENATTKYAVSIGKTREQLNAFERTQAVFNDVLQQGETKFSAIAKLMDPDAFALGQLMKELDDLLMSFQKFMVEGLLPIIKFFKENSLALVAAMGLFVLPIIRSLLPSLDEAFKNSMFKMQSNSRLAVSSFKKMRSSFGDVNAAFQDRNMNAQTSGDYFNKLGAADKGGGPNEARLNKRQIAAYRRHLNEKTGLYKKMTRDQRNELRRHLNMQEALIKGSTAKTLSVEKAAAQVWKGIWAGKTVVVAAATTAWRGMLAATAAFANKAFAAAAWLGMIAMVIMGMKSLMERNRNLNDHYRRTNERTKELTTSTKELNDELYRMLEVQNSGLLLNSKSGTEATGQFMTSANIPELMKNYNQQIKEGKKPSDDVIVGFRKQMNAATKLAPGLFQVAEAMQNGKRLTNDQQEAAERLANSYINAGQAASKLTQNQESLNKSLDKQIRKFTKIPFQDLLTQYTTTIQGGMDALGMERRKDAQGNLLDPSRLKQSRNENDDRMGMLGQYDTTQRSRNKRLAKLKSDMVTSTGSKYYRKHMGSGAGGQVIDFAAERDADGNVTKLKERAAVQKELNALGFTQEDTFYKVFSGNMELYTAAEENLKTQKDLGKQSQEDLDIMNRTRETLRQQFVVMQAIEKLQEQGIENERLRLVGALELSRLQTLGTSLANQDAILDQQKLNLADKVRDAQLKETEAGVALTATKEKLKGILKEEGVTLEELGKMTTQQLIDRAKELTISTKEVENAKQGVTNAGEEVKISKNNKILKEQQLDLQIALLINQQGVTDQLRIQAALMRSQAVSAKQIALDLKKNPTSVGKAAARTKKITNIGLKQTQNTALAGAYESQRGDLEADKGNFGVKGAVDADGLIIATKNDFQKKYNALLQKEIALKQQNNLLDIDSATLTAESKGEFIMGTLKATKETAKFQREQVFSLNPATQLYNETVLKLRQNGVEEAKIDHELIKQQAIATEHLKIETELMSGVTSTLSNGFVSMFQTMVDGTKSFKEGMKDLTKSVLTDLAAMFAKAAALKILLALFPGMGNMMTGINAIPGMGGGRYGGQMTKFRYGGYAGGGVADGPESGYMAMLHGREAVVPLGNDRSIPVDMRGMPGGGNIVTVNITMNGQGQGASQVTGDGMQGLGRSIGNMVQQHLQQEMRPGGLLNQQGTKGRA